MQRNDEIQATPNETGRNQDTLSAVTAADASPKHELSAAFDLLGLFDRFVLPVSVLSHLDVNTRKLLRVCCKRLRAEVDATVTSLLVNRYNVSKLTAGPPGALARRYPRLRRLAFGANEPRDVATLLRTHLPSLATSLECVDLWAYYASISTDLWAALVEHAPAALRLRLNINESLLRRMEVEQGLAALAALRRGRPGLVVEFNTGHTFFGFRSTDAATLRALAAAGYVRSLGFSIGLRGRELQNGTFFSHLAPAPEAGGSTAAAPADKRDGSGGGGGGGSAAVVPPPPPSAAAAAAMIEALSLTHYESEERPPVGPLLQQLHLLTALRSLTLDCEISLGELEPLAACSALTRLTIDLLLARPHAPRATAALPPQPSGTSVVGAVQQPPLTALPQVLSLTLGSESHPAQPLAAVFPGLTELVSEPCTRKVGVYNIFPCPLMLSGAACLTRLTIACVVAAEAPAALAEATALTALAFTHADNASTAGMLTAAAQLPGLRRLALWDHEEADEYLSLADHLPPPPLPLPPPLVLFQAAVAARPSGGGSDLIGAAGVPYGGGGAPHSISNCGGGDGGGGGERPGGGLGAELGGVDAGMSAVGCGGAASETRDANVGADWSAVADANANTIAGAGAGVVVDLDADPGAACCSRRGGASSRTQSPPAPVLSFWGLREFEVRATSPEFFEEILSALRSGVMTMGPALKRVRLDACYDPPLLRWEQLGALLAALGPGLRSAVVSGWATPGSEGMLLSLGARIGRPELRLEYEYPIL